MRQLGNELNNIDDAIKIYKNSDVSLDLIHSLCGKKINNGAFRDVYEYNLNNNWVVKIEHGNGSSNGAEAFIWNEIRWLEGNLAWVKDWFAPVIWTSPNKKILIMQKTEERPDKKRPEKVPAFFSDVKWENWGWIGNKFVCHDYGFLHRFIKYENKMQKIIW